MKDFLIYRLRKEQKKKLCNWCHFLKSETQLKEKKLTPESKMGLGIYDLLFCYFSQYP